MVLTAEGFTVGPRGEAGFPPPGPDLSLLSAQWPTNGCLQATVIFWQIILC